MKQAFFVIGPESSGTRMLTQAFISAGCYGDGEHQQRMDDLDFHRLPKRIVLRRSVPHDGVWGGADKIITLMQAAEYPVDVFIIARDKGCTARSQVRVGLASDGDDALQRIVKAWKYIEAEVGDMGPSLHYVCYEAFVADAEHRRDIFAAVGLPEPRMEFYNANAKYFEQPAQSTATESVHLGGGGRAAHSQER